MGVGTRMRWFGGRERRGVAGGHGRWVEGSVTCGGYHLGRVCIRAGLTVTVAVVAGFANDVNSKHRCVDVWEVLPAYHH